MKKKKITQLLAAMSLALIVSMVLPSTIQAADPVTVGGDALYDALEIVGADTAFTADAKGTITVNMGDAAGAGAEFSAYRLLDITTDEHGKVTGYTLNADFTGLWNALGVTTAADLAAVNEKGGLTINKIVDQLYAMKNTDPSTLPTGAEVKTATAGADGKAVLTDLPMGMYAVLQTDATAAAGTAGYINSAPILVTLPYEKTTGEGEGATTEYDTVIEVNAKNDKPTVEKKIDADDNTTDTTQDYQKEATKAVGSTVEYTTTITVPQYNLSNVTKEHIAEIRLGIEDTLTNQTYNAGSLKVYGFAAADADTSDLAKIQDGDDLTNKFTCENPADSASFTSYVRDYTTLLNENSDPAQNKWVNKYNKIVFYYQATVTTAAVVGTPQPNNVTYVYQNDVSGTTWDSKKTDDEGNDKPDDEWKNPDTPVDKPKDSTKLYIYGLNIYKYETLSGGKSYLAGAKFSIQENSKDMYFIIEKEKGIYELYKTFDPTGKTATKTYYTDSTYTTLSGDTADGTAVTDFFLDTYTDTIVTVKKTYYTDDTYATKSGVAADGTTVTEFFKETYTDTPVTVTKDIVSAANKNSTGTDNADGNLQVIGLDEGTYTLTENKAPTGFNAAAPSTIIVTAQKNEGILSGNVDGQTDGFVNYELENKSGLTLPSTGGIGTIVVTAGGILLILGCLTFITTKRSKEKYTE